jgi:hypothetical protein
MAADLIWSFHILKLPSYGDRLYRAMDPLFGMVVCAMVSDPTNAEKILKRMRYIETGTNVSCLCLTVYDVGQLLTLTECP